MNERMWIIIVAFVIDIKCANANSIAFNQAYHNRKTWKAASGECGSNGLQFDEKVLTNIDVLLDKEFWIGMAIYRVITPWIEILGCFAVPDGQEVNKSPSIVLCQKQCESFQFFGYSESTMMCSCQHNKGSASNLNMCIDQNNSAYFFVYNIFNGTVSGNDDGKCTTLYCYDGNNGIKAANCNDTSDAKRASICNNGYIVGWGALYSTSKQKCLDRYQLLLPPETYCQLNDHQNKATPSWTNVFRAETEAKLTQTEAGHKVPLDCLAGSLTENNGKRELDITRRFCNNQLDYYVCRTGSASLITSNESKDAVPIHEKFSSTTRASRVQNIEHGAASSTSKNQIIIATQKMTKDSSGSFDIGPVIGGVVAAVILIVVSLVVISCKIRSCGVFKTTSMDKQEVSFSTAVSEHSQNSEVRTSVTPTSNESYGLAPITSNNTYAVVNKIKKNGLQTTEDTYTETSYGEYDRLNGVPKRRTDSKTNLYDSHEGIRNETDPTYDSSNHGGIKIQLDNAVYDHTDTVPTYQSDYGYSSTIRSGVRNENSAYDDAV